MVLLGAEGLPNAEIARTSGASPRNRLGPPASLRRQRRAGLDPPRLAGHPRSTRSRWWRQPWMVRADRPPSWVSRRLPSFGTKCPLDEPAGAKAVLLCLERFGWVRELADASAK